MRIVFFIEKDYDFVFPMLQRLIPDLIKENVIVGAFNFPSRLTKFKGGKIYLKYYEIFGAFVFIKLIFRVLRNRFNMVMKRLLGKSSFFTFESLFEHYRIPYLQADSPNNKEVVSWIKKQNVDVVMNHAGFILKADILNAPNLCILNKHASLLPSCKGVFPVFWCLYHDLPLGLTIHKVNEKIDEGQIIVQKKYNPMDDFSVYDYYQVMFQDTCDLILQSIQKVSKNECQETRSDLEPSYYSLPSRKDYESFQKKGCRFI